MHRIYFDKQWNTGPALRVIFFLKNALVKKISLEYSDSFCGQIWDERDNSALHQSIEAWLLSYLQKKPFSSKIPLDMSSIPPFSQQVLETLSAIPFGSTLTYKNIAEKLGNAKKARGVGRACHTNPFPLFIPCHRVVGSQGHLTGYFFGLEMKKSLLDFETTLIYQ